MTLILCKISVFSPLLQKILFALAHSSVQEICEFLPKKLNSSNMKSHMNPTILVDLFIFSKTLFVFVPTRRS